MSKTAFPVRLEAGASFCQLAFRVSSTLACPRCSLEQLLRLLKDSRHFRWAALEVLTRVEPERWEFAGAEDFEDQVLLRTEALTDCVSVAIDAAVYAEDVDEARLFLALTAQQVAQFVHRILLEKQNAAMYVDLRIMSEQVALAKFVERAKSLIVARRGLSANEAEEWLRGASVRFRKPLLKVAQEIVTAFKTPGFAA
jgi:ANTAR domain